MSFVLPSPTRASPTPPARLWLTVSGIYLALQVLAGIAAPAAGWVTTGGFGAQCLLAAMYATWRAGGRGRPAQWWTLAAAFTCWAATYLAIAVEEQVVGPNPQTGLVDDVLFVARAVPFLLLFTAGLSDRRDGADPVRRADFATAAIFVLLAAVVVLGDPLARAHGVSSAVARFVRDIENVVLAGVAIATLRAQRRAADRAFYAPVAALLTVYVVSATVLNHLVIPRIADAPGSPWLAFGAVPFVAFHLIAARCPRPARFRAQGLLAQHLAPALLTAASLALAFAAVHAGSVIGALLGMGALAAYAWRTSLAELDARSVNAVLRREGAQLASLALTDPLTGIANRRAFDAALAAAWSDAAAAGIPIAVLCIDIDRFKALNDAHGHAAGDTCLVRLAQALASVSSPAICARLGGEEFGVVAVGNLDRGAALAEGLRDAVAGLALPHPDAPGGRVTVSIGVAARVPDPAATAAVLLAEADAALYAAKANGRDRIETAWADRPSSAMPRFVIADLSRRPLSP